MEYAWGKQPKQNKTRADVISSWLDIQVQKLGQVSVLLKIYWSSKNFDINQDIEDKPICMPFLKRRTTIFHSLLHA
jgi:hypothetical protein